MQTKGFFSNRVDLAISDARTSLDFINLLACLWIYTAFLLGSGFFFLDFCFQVVTLQVFRMASHAFYITSKVFARHAREHFVTWVAVGLSWLPWEFFT